MSKSTPLLSLVVALEKIAPPHLAESWDNVGLLVGDPTQNVTRVMLTIDYTPLVAEEAREERCDCVIAYHPPIFDAVKRVTTAGATSLIYDAIRRGVAIYSPHTALDVADGGTNDVLADGIAMVDRRPLKLSKPAPTHYKLVTFAPADAIEHVAQALFDAGAGTIGQYSRCSFRAEGVGTFVGNDNASPAIGSRGKFEQVEEMKLETVVPIGKAESVVAALRATHPYEEAAFDLQMLAGDPTPRGIGRIGKIPGDATADMLVNMLKRALEINHVLIAGEPGRLIKRAAVCAGACGGDLLSEAIEQKADLYVTGEMRHHDAIRAVRHNLTVVCTLHSNSERATLKRLADRISAALPALPFLVSRRDQDPFSVM